MSTEKSAREALLDAALTYVAFDGWSQAAFAAAAQDTGIAPDKARALYPRGAFDLAVAYHRRGDAIMLARLKAADLGRMRVRERVTFAVRTRIEAICDKEAARRASALFALPQNAPQGARLIWDTADAIWDALDDPSNDFNWYSKRMILSGVYSATVLFWLGDKSPDCGATWDFLDRRIGEVMNFEKFKGQLRENPLTKGLFARAEGLLSRVREPSRTPRDDLPGRWTGDI